jgi:hypothetical protein
LATSGFFSIWYEAAQPFGLRVAELAVTAVVYIDLEFGIEEFCERPVAEVEHITLMHRQCIVENSHVAGA